MGVIKDKTIYFGNQWRLQYRRVIELAGQETGVTAIYQSNL